MDLESTFSTIGAMIPQELDVGQVISSAADLIPADVSRIIKHAASYVPAEIDLAAAFQFLLYFSVASLVLGVLGRVVLGKRSSLNHSLSSTMAILFIYAVSILVYTFRPWKLDEFLTPLPFVTLSGEYLIVLPIMDMEMTALCSEILSLIILAFLVNLLDTIMPKGKNAVSWYILRFMTVVMAMGLHLVVRWAFHHYLPDVLVTYAPGILLALLAVMLFTGVLGLILGLVIAVVNPFVGAMYTFFFTNVIGKQLSKAIFSSAIICGIFYCLDRFGYTLIHLTAAALGAYVPLVIVLLLLWYLIGHVL